MSFVYCTRRSWRVLLFFGQRRIDAIKQCCDKWVGTQRLGAAVVTRDGYVPHTQCGAGLAPVVVVLLLLLVLPVVAYEMRLEFLQQQQEQLELGHNMWQAFAASTASASCLSCAL